MKALKIFAITSALFLSTGISVAQTMDEAVQKYTDAMAKAKEQAFGEALTLLKDAMMVSFDLGEEGMELTKEIQRNIPKIQFYSGINELKASNFDAAIEQLLAASEMAELYGDITTMRQANRAISGVYQQQGVSAFNNKDFETALESFKKGYEQDPSNVKLALLTAKSYAELNQLFTAVEIYNTVIEVGTSNSKFEEDATQAKKDIETYALIAASEAAKTNDIKKIEELLILAPQSDKLALLGLQVANNAKKFDYIIANAETAAALQKDEASKSDVYFILAVAQDNKSNKNAAVAAAQKVTEGNNVAAAKAIIDRLK